MLIRVELCLYCNLPRGARWSYRGVCGSTSRSGSSDARPTRSSRRLSPARGGLPEGIEIIFKRLPPGFAILPGWLEDALPFRLPRGPIYGSEAIAVVGGREVPLGALLMVGMYDEASGQGVVFREEEIEPQVEGVRRAARELLAGVLELR